MPIYVYRNEETGEERDVVLPYQKRDSYEGEDGDTGTWKRIPHRVNVNVASITKIDPWDKKSFNEATSQKKGTFGDIVDLSEELSEKRKEQNGGIDPIKEEYKKNYEKKNGKQLVDPTDQPKVSKNGISIDFSDED